MLKRNRQTDPPETVTRIEAKAKANFDPINTEKDIINGFPSVFLDSLGRCTKMKAKLFLKQNVEPFFRRKQPVPFSALHCVEEELSRLEKNGCHTTGIPRKMGHRNCRAYVNKVEAFGYALILPLVLMPL